VKTGLLGRGKMFGETDVVAQRPYSNTIKWFSTKGTCLKIDSDKLINLISEFHPVTHDLLKSSADDGQQSINKYLNKNKEFENSSKLINKFKDRPDKVERIE
jgi:CRP-like cAMP-binding protein